MTKKPGILWISDSRESLPIAWRVQQEGVTDNYVYIHDKIYKRNFEGIMPRISMNEIPRVLKRCQTVIIDITLPWHDKPHDKALHSVFGIHGKQEGVFGPIADKLMKTHKVIGSSTWSQHVELDREAGFKLAQKIGFDIPKYQKFKGLKEGIKFLQGEGGKQKWVFKMLNNGPLDLSYPEKYIGELLDMMQTILPVRFQKMKPPVNENKIEYILQELVEGTECSNELWWNGEEFLNANKTIESKKLGDGDTGPATGSQANLVTLCDDMNGPVFKELQKLEPYLKLSGYIGPLDANIIYNEQGKLWWLEATFRFGYSAIYCFLKFIPEGQLNNFFLNGFRAVFKDGYVASQLLSLYPYPNPNQSELAQMVENVWVNHKIDDPNCWYQDVYLGEDDKLRCGGADGMIAVITAHDESPQEAMGKVKKACEKLSVSGNKQYRSDQELKHMKRINKLKSIGVEF